MAQRNVEIASTEAMRHKTEIKRARTLFFSMAMLVDFASICAAMFISDFSYNLFRHNAFGLSDANLQLGYFAATLFVGSNLARNSYTVSDYLDLSGHAKQTLTQWNMSFLAAATFGFMTKVIEDSSRGTFLLFYIAGLIALYAGRSVLVQIMKERADRGSALTSRVLIVGFKNDIEEFIRMNPMSRQGMQVIAKAYLNENRAPTDADLNESVAIARREMPDDIIIVVPWERTDVIDRCVTAFMRVPASLHLNLGQHCPLNRFDGAQMASYGASSSFRLRGMSMSALGVGLKRASDIVLSAIALVLLSPLFLLVSAAIKLETGGPVLFLQTRHGFNKAPFRILKFRSMGVTEDGAAVRQAVANDPRITRVGRVLRKFNIDEMPQLVNVLLGQMSLVGPRPHAMLHDQVFEQNIALYARRHNVKPGITGWAQVNGLRGETNTPDKIAQRVHHDLYYIDNWSFVFDIWIIFLTVFSRKAYLNAA